MAAKENRPDAAPESSQTQIRVGVDERSLQTSYANAFRTNATPEEVILDFGLNLVNPSPSETQPQVVFHINQRIIMNYLSAKRLALTLSQIISRHEEQFGVLELDAAKRRKS